MVNNNEQNLNKVCAIILAGGTSSRMHTDLPKPLLKVLDDPMLEWTISACEKSGITEICVVAGYKSELVEGYINNRSKSDGCSHINVVVQETQEGTGHAAMQAVEFLQSKQGYFENTLILNGDTPFLDVQTILTSLKEHKENDAAMTLITAINAKASVPVVQRGSDGSILGVEESYLVSSGQSNHHAAATQEHYAGAAWFKTGSLISLLPELPSGKDGEYYLTDMVHLFNAQKDIVKTHISANPNIVLDADTKRELYELNELARHEILTGFLDSGVEFLSLDGVIIGRRVMISAGATILPGSILRGETVIGAGSVIGPNTLLENCIIGKNVKLNAIQAYDSRVDDGASIGPFAHLRPGTVIGKDAKLGDFVEIKNSTIGEHTSIAHLTYLGDSDVGSYCNFGCGCVTANYDGQNKHRTVIGDEAFLGCHTRLIAPVKVGNRVYTAAGTTITKDVPDGALAIERTEVKIKEGYGDSHIKHNLNKDK